MFEQLIILTIKISNKFFWSIIKKNFEIYDDLQNSNKWEKIHGNFRCSLMTEKEKFKFGVSKKIAKSRSKTKNSGNSSAANHISSCTGQLYTLRNSNFHWLFQLHMEEQGLFLDLFLAGAKFVRDGERNFCGFNYGNGRYIERHGKRGGFRV